MMAFVPVVFETVCLVAIVLPHFMQVTTFARAYFSIMMGAFFHTMKSITVVFHFAMFHAGNISFTTTMIC